MRDLSLRGRGGRSAAVKESRLSSKMEDRLISGRLANASFCLWSSALSDSTSRPLPRRWPPPLADNRPRYPSTDGKALSKAFSMERDDRADRTALPVARSTRDTSRNHRVESSLGYDSVRVVFVSVQKRTFDEQNSTCRNRRLWSDNLSKLGVTYTMCFALSRIYFSSLFFK